MLSESISLCLFTMKLAKLSEMETENIFVKLWCSLKWIFSLPHGLLLVLMFCRDTSSILYSSVSLCLCLTLARAYIVLPSNVNPLMSSLTNKVMAFHFRIWCAVCWNYVPLCWRKMACILKGTEVATAPRMLCCVRALKTSLWEFLIKTLNETYCGKQDFLCSFEMEFNVLFRHTVLPP